MSEPDLSLSVKASASSGGQPPVGIDLGTTFSVLAYVDRTGRPATVPNSSGELLTPSAVFFDDNDVIVGQEARKSSVISPETYAECFKRDMGMPAYRRKIRGSDVPPEVLSAFVLERLKHDAQRRLGPIQKVVITVPAFFDETRRRATQEAGRLAGLEVLDIINEPTAAAVAFGHQHGFMNLRAGGVSDRLRLLVYDLGGGTFDVTVLEIAGTQFRALATDGDVQLGGRDFDERLVSRLAEQFQAAHGVDPRSDPHDAAQLWLDAIEAKHSLTERAKTNIVCFHAGIRCRQEVTRQQFEDLTRDLLERTETTSSLVVNQAGLTWDQIDRVLLVGAMRMPMVVEMLRRVTGKEPDRSVSADEVVAHGAALYAEMLMGSGSGSTNPRCELVNVNSHCLGLVGFDKRLRQEVNVVLIPKNTPLPSRASRKCCTIRADQRTVMVPVVEGEGHRAEDCIKLGSCVVHNLPPGLPAGTRVEVEYRYGGNGCVSVSARVPSARQSAHVEIQRDLARNLEDLPMWKARLCGRVEPLAASPAEEAAAVDPADRSSVVKRLDSLCTKVGLAAVQLKVPESVEQSRRSALAAAHQWKRAEQALTEAQRQREGAVSTADIIRFDAALSQARRALHQAQVKSDFAHVLLGRECVSARFSSPGLDRDLDEIRRWQKHLEQMQS